MLRVLLRLNWFIRVAQFTGWLGYWLGYCRTEHWGYELVISSWHTRKTSTRNA